MIFRLPIAVLFSGIFFFTAAAQETPIQHIKVSSGEVVCVKYYSGIYKLTYTPTGYTKNENISDAVNTRPRAENHPLKAIKAHGDTVEFFTGNTRQSIRLFYKDGQAGFKFPLLKTTRVFGGGERALPLNRRGYKFNLYNNPWYGYSEGADNLNYSVPFFTTSDGYGLFFDNASKGYADIGKSDSSTLEVGFASGEINVYILLGNDYKQILSGYNHLTGTQPLPPRWAMGNLMSRFGYSSETQAKDILGKMKEQGIPVDAIIFDLFWFGDSIKGTMGNLDWMNKQKWPDPKKMISDFKKENVQTILITEPFVVKSSTNYSNAEKFLAVDSAGKPYNIADFYFGAGGLIDIFRKDAQDWFWSKHTPQMKIGVEAWWGDLGEPEKHPANLYHNLKDLGFNKRLFSADEVHNLYGHTWTKMLYEKYAKDYPAKRLFSLNRSGFAGTQRYGIFPWSGDVSRSWSGLRSQLPVMLGMSMSGIPYAHADAGGFAGGEGDNELYVRWLQFAAFTPVFRPHGTELTGFNENTFSFPSEAALIAEPFRSYAKAAINLRYALLPYNYTLAYKQSKNGEPLVAPLYYYYPKDTTAINIGDEYMWGENILVAPVLQKSATNRKLYLPEGNWYDLFTNEIKKGAIIDSVNLERIPLYVKEGSFISFWDPSKAVNPVTTDYISTKEFEASGIPLTVYYPSEKISSGSFYFDDGVTKRAKGENIFFKGQTKNGVISITISTDSKNRYAKRDVWTDPARILWLAIPYDVKPVESDQKLIIEKGKLFFLQTGNENKKNYSMIRVIFSGANTTIQLKIDK